MLAQVVLFDGFDLLDAVAPFEVLWAGGVASGGALRVELVSLEGPRLVPSGPSGASLPATAALDPVRADVVVIPGAAGAVSGDGPGSVPAILARAVESGLADAVAPRLAREDRLTATVCGGSLVLAMPGLLAGRHATTHHLGRELLVATGANAIDARVVDDGNLVSAGGVTSGLDLGTYLLERLVGARIAHSVERLFEHERRGTVWTARGLAPVAA